jgi:hypothetical protein
LLHDLIETLPVRQKLEFPRTAGHASNSKIDIAGNSIVLVAVRKPLV